MNGCEKREEDGGGEKLNELPVVWREEIKRAQDGKAGALACKSVYVCVFQEVWPTTTKQDEDDNYRVRRRANKGR